MSNVETQGLTEGYIIDKIAIFFDVEKKDIFSKLRRSDVAQARQYIMYYLYYYGVNCKFSYSDVAREMEKRGSIKNHATVIWAINKLNGLLEVSVDANQTMTELNVWVGIEKKSYVNIHYFMKVSKNDIVPLRFSSDPQGKILWRHKSIEKRGNRMYIVGEIRKNGLWEESTEDIYQYEGLLCYGWDADKLYIDEPEIL